MHLILTGATGVVGSTVLEHMLSLPRGTITKISILSRKPVLRACCLPHVNVILHEDFNSYPREILDQLEGAEGCVWALGTSTKTVSEEETKKITVDFPIAAAEAFAGLSDDGFNFVYVSQQDARIKSLADKRLFELIERIPKLYPYSARPGFLDISSQPNFAANIPPHQTTIVKKLIQMLTSVRGMVYPRGTINTAALASALTYLAIGIGAPVMGSKGGKGLGKGRALGNVDLRRLAKVSKAHTAAVLSGQALVGNFG